MLADSLPRALAALVLLTVSCDRGSLLTSPDPPELPESPATLLESGRKDLRDVEWSPDETEIYYTYSVGGHRQLAAHGATPGAAEGYALARRWPRAAWKITFTQWTVERVLDRS